MKTNEDEPRQSDLEITRHQQASEILECQPAASGNLLIQQFGKILTRQFKSRVSGIRYTFNVWSLDQIMYIPTCNMEKLERSEAGKHQCVSKQRKTDNRKQTKAWDIWDRQCRNKDTGRKEKNSEEFYERVWYSLLYYALLIDVSCLALCLTICWHWRPLWLWGLRRLALPQLPWAEESYMKIINSSLWYVVTISQLSCFLSGHIGTWCISSSGTERANSFGRKTSEQNDRSLKFPKHTVDLGGERRLGQFVSKKWNLWRHDIRKY